LHWFAALDTPFIGDFLKRWPTLQAVQKIDEATLLTFFQAHHAHNRAINQQRMDGIRQAIPATTDQAVIRAWMGDRYPDYEGEAWSSFRTRIQACANDLSSNHHPKAIAIFTSATPIAIITGAALGLTDERLLHILGVIYNTSVSVMKPRNGELRLFTFNSTPHLDSSNRTFR